MLPKEFELLEEFTVASAMNYENAVHHLQMFALGLYTPLDLAVNAKVDIDNLVIYIDNDDVVRFIN